jgi:hypothetical protein
MSDYDREEKKKTEKPPETYYERKSYERPKYIILFVGCSFF